ncbi:MAG TPA: tetratricopeptide repeat protein [Bacteroidia bacterium]|nr:tetratricopeptide repeat protein [Bacteroidia bacterium]
MKINKFLKRILVFSFLLCPIVSTAQNTALLDTFMTQYNKATHDTVKIKALYDISWLYMNANIDTSLQLSDRGLAWSEKNNFRWGLSKGFILRGIYQTIKGEFTLALESYEECLKIKSEDKDSLGIASVLNNIGNVYLYRGDYDKAIEYFLKSIAIEETHGTDERLAESYMNVGSVYSGMKRYHQALQYYKKYIELNDGLGKDNAVSEAANNIGGTYMNLNKIDSAYIYFLQAEKTALKWGNKTALATSYIGQANYFIKNNQLDKAFELLEQAIRLSEESGNTQQLAATHIDAGNIALKNKRLDQAFYHANTARTQALSIGAKKEISNAYLLLSNVEQQRNNFKSAFDFLELHTLYSDSILNEQANETIAEMQTRFETEKKNAENTLLRSENQIKSLTIEKQDRQKNVLIAIAAIILLFAYVLFMYKKARQEKLIQTERMAMQEQRSKAVIEAEENERQRIARELHDGVGQMIAAIKLNFQNVVSDKAKSEVLYSDKVANVNSMIDECAKEVRSISHNMMPNVLIRSGLVKAVRDFIDKISSTGLLRMELQVVGMEERMDPTFEHILYRVLQEIVSNIVKHAQANHVSIQFIRHDQHLTLMIEDNGKGFNIDQKENFSGMGLKNIQSRIEYLNGEVHFDSFPGKGTTVSIEIPLSS